MKTLIKIPRDLFEQAKADLFRRHRFAGERVGFFSTRCSRTNSLIIVHCIAYNPVKDDHYIEDPTVGVRIGPAAITEAMTRSLKNSVGQIHVHWHGGSGLPHPSPTDTNELPAVQRSLRNANVDEAHGWMVLGNHDGWTSIFLPGSRVAVLESPITIVGFPMAVNHRESGNSLEKLSDGLKKIFKRKKPDGRYHRQTFLGDKSEIIIGSIKIGVIGLGGGGSHVTQQLAHLGFKNFDLFDPDKISKSNLNRLVGGTLADVKNKRLKVIIAERVIKQLHADAKIQCHASKWENAAENLMECDLVFGCVDTFAARRDLEAFCRRNLIPYIDVGMDVHELKKGHYEITGQVILSMPGKPCMHCMGFLNDEVLGLEAQKYGAAGSNPQVVWTNGILCSAAVGIGVDILTDWSRKTRQPLCLGFKGSEISLQSDKRLNCLQNHQCAHYPLDQAGDVKIKKL